MQKAYKGTPFKHNTKNEQTLEYATHRKTSQCTSECSGVRAQRFVFRMKIQPQTDNTQKVVQLHSRQSEGKLVAIHE